MTSGATAIATLSPLGLSWAWCQCLPRRISQTRAVAQHACLGMAGQRHSAFQAEPPSIRLAKNWAAGEGGIALLVIHGRTLPRSVTKSRATSGKAHWRVICSRLTKCRRTEILQDNPVSLARGNAGSRCGRMRQCCLGRRRGGRVARRTAAEAGATSRSTVLSGRRPAHHKERGALDGRIGLHNHPSRPPRFRTASHAVTASGR